MSLETDVEWKRLCGVYAEQSDEQLLNMYEEREDLTDLAQQALEQVMKDRKLEPRKTIEPEPEEFSEAERDEMGLAKDESPLCGFADGLEASAATDVMTKADIPFRIVPPTRAGYGLTMIVKTDDLEDARELLHAKMGLFPVTEADGGFDELTGWEPVGIFARAEALTVARLLGENEFSFIWDDAAEVSGKDQSVTISVKHSRLEQAMKMVDSMP